MKKTLRKKNDIQSILQNYFLLLIVTVLVLISIMFSALQYRTYRSSALETLQNAASTVADSIETNLNQLDAIVLNAISSNLTEEITKYADLSSSEYEHLQIRKQLTSDLLSHKGFDYSVRQLNIFSVSGTGYGLGDYTGAFSDCTTEDWFENTLDRNGRKYISVVDTGGRTYLSLRRAFYDVYHHAAGIIEGRMYYSDFFESVLRDSYQYNADVLVYNAGGEIVASSNTGSSIFFPYPEHIGTEPVRLKNTVGGKNEYAVYSLPESEDFLVVMTVDTGELMKPVLQTLSVTGCFFVTVLVIGYLLSRIMSRRISLPIRDMYHFLSDRDTMHSETYRYTAAGIKEIDRLADSINEYITRSKEQTDTIISLNRQETTAQMLALQSQMNPHFLYNSLASIAEMSRVGMNEAVTVMTANISDMLRYISSSSDSLTPAGNEFDLCDKYLECMKLRFGDNLRYSFHIDDGLWDLRIPKLCVQLLIENSIKAMTRLPSPWIITVNGLVQNGRWIIEVLDNGSGFDADVLSLLAGKTGKILSSGEIPSLEINGSGMLNIFTRFYLLYGTEFVFEYGNRECGGAFVRIGHSLTESEFQQQ